MGKEPENPLLLQQSRNKIKAAFVVLQVVFALLWFGSDTKKDVR